MAGLTPDQLRLALWFLLAGIILGFSVSTLWEWLYFRRKRVRQADSSRYALADNADQLRRYELTPVVAVGSGALLDSEQPAVATAESRDAEAAPLASPAEPALLFGAARRVEQEHAESALSEARADVTARPRGVAPTLVRDTDAVQEARSRGFPDDLTQIAGVTRADQQRLYAANIYTWHQVATSDPRVLAQVTGAGEDARVDRWPAKARALAERHGRINAAYSGPPPDDLTRIQGIHAPEAQALYHAGITSYRQLAETPRAELAELFPDGGRDFDSWRRVADQLARARPSGPPAAPPNGVPAQDGGIL